MRLRAPAILLATRPHAENGSIVRLFTQEAGLVAAYVAGGRGRRLRPVLVPGNRVAAEIAARSDSQLPFARLELVESRAPYLAEPLIAAAMAWVTALTAASLPERSAYPLVYDALDGLLTAICTAPSARGWLRALILYERLLLRELGYGESRLPLPEDSREQLALFASQGRAIGHYLLSDQRADIIAARDMLHDRLERMIG